jgi:hypothetical protein
MSEIDVRIPSLPAAGVVMAGRVVLIGAGLGLWYLTQSLLAKRTTLQSDPDGGAICDGIHQLTAPWHRKLLANTRAANLLLIFSSLVIDLLGFYLLGSAIVGPTFRPFIGLLMLFALRQICQAFCPLPPPSGMIWRNPGFPTVLVTYGTSNDLFFSGHTAIAIYGAVYLGSTLGPIGIALGILVAIFEIGTVLILRAHYTMDVFTGAITALYVNQLAWKFAPCVDQFLARLGT